MRPLLALTPLLFLAIACERPPADEPERSDPPTDQYPEALPPKAPEPVDTAAVVAEARALAAEIDAAEDKLTHRERTVDPAVPGGSPLRLALWERDGLPVRMEVTRANDGETTVSTYYFDEDTRLRYVRHPDASYVLARDGTLLVWTDEAGAVRHDIPEESRRARAAALETEAREYLEEFIAPL